MTAMEFNTPSIGINPAAHGAVYTATPTTAQATANLTALDDACALARSAGVPVHITGMLGINGTFNFPSRMTVQGDGFYWDGSIATSTGSCIFDAGVSDYGTLFAWGSTTQTDPHWWGRLNRIGVVSTNTTVQTLAIQSRWASTNDYDSTRKGRITDCWIVGGNVQVRWGPDPTPSPYATAHATGTYYSAHRFVTSGGYIYRCVRTGVSGSSAPTFPTTTYATVEESTISGLTARANTTAYAVGDILRNTGADRVFVCKVAGTSAGSAPATYATAAVGDEVTDGSVTWVRVNLAKWECRGTTPISTSWEAQSDDFTWDSCYFSGYAYPVRASSTAYAIGDIRVDPLGTDRSYRCTVAGTSASSSPGGFDSANVGGTISDGTVTWTRVENPIRSLGGVVVNGANAADATRWVNCGFSACSAENEAYIFIRGGYHHFDDCYAGGDGTNTRVFLRIFADTPITYHMKQSEKMYATIQVPFDGETGYTRSINLINCTFNDEVQVLKSRRVTSTASYYDTISAGSPTGARLVLGAGIRYVGTDDYFYDDRSVIIGASSFFVNVRGENASTVNGVYQQNELVYRLGTFASGQPLYYAVTQQGRESATTRANSTPYLAGAYIQNASGSHTFYVKTGGTTAGAEPGGVTSPTIGADTTDGTAVLTCVNTTPILTPVSVAYSPSSAYTVTGSVPDRTYNAGTALVGELNQVVAAIIADLQARGVLG